MSTVSKRNYELSSSSGGGGGRSSSRRRSSSRSRRRSKCRTSSRHAYIIGLAYSSIVVSSSSSIC